MARAIDADEFMKNFDKEIENGATDVFDAVGNALEETPTIEAELVKQEWISVNDRLPEFGEKIYCRRNTDTVLAWDGYEYVMGYFTHHSQLDEVEFNGVDEDGNYMVKTPTHWMPLPEPPKEEE